MSALPDGNLLVSPITEIKDAACSKKRPRMLLTRMFSLLLECRAVSEQTPRHDQVDTHAGSRCFIEPSDHAGIFESVHFQNDVSVTALLVLDNFFFDQMLQAAAEAVGRHQQLAVRKFLRRIAGQVIEQIAQRRLRFPRHR